jgi:hypothetical protein
MKADFDIGNLLYVVLTIVFLAVGALGKKKKPVQKVSEEPQDATIDTDTIKSQFQDLFRELNPTTQLLREQEYQFIPTEKTEEEPLLDSVPKESSESAIDVIPVYEQPIDSNINYNDQAQSSLDTTGMDEGEPVFDYKKDHNSLVYNDLTKEYDSVLAYHEEELAEIIDGFDPKTAFVYSEIFKRKEFL